MKPLFPWELDLRSLGVFRIALGLAMFVQIIWRLVNVEWWYAPDGFAGQPVRDLVAGFPDLSIFAGDTTTLPVKIALWLSIPLAALLTLGVYARPAAWILAFIFAELQIHNPVFLGNELWVMLWSLVWGGLLPFDRAFSIYRKPLQETSVASGAALGLLVQIGLVYTMNGYYKDDASWATGTALREIVDGGMYSRPPLDRAFLILPDWLQRFLTICILYLERFALPLLLLPWQWLRLFVVVSLMAFHLASAIATSVGLYPLMSIIWLIALLPSLIWRRQTEALPAWKTAASVFAVGLLFYVAWLNIFDLSGKINAVTTNLKSLGIYQVWKNFTSPDVTTGIPLFIAETPEGQIDLYRWRVSHEGEHPSRELPEDYNQAYGGKWWNWFAEPQRKVIVNIVESGNYNAFKTPAAYLCRDWQKSHPEQPISSVTVQFNTPEGIQDLWQGKCPNP